MRVCIECAVYACMIIALYNNWTSMPQPKYTREVRGILEKVQHEFPY